MARCFPAHGWWTVRTAALTAALLGTAACGPPDSAGGPVRPPGDAERGRKLLAQYQCGSCHAIPGVPSSLGQEAPPLQSFGLRSYIAGRVANRPDLLAQWIAQPQALVPDTKMPNMGVWPQDAQDMAAYLLELR